MLRHSSRLLIQLLLFIGCLFLLFNIISYRSTVAVSNPISRLPSRSPQPTIYGKHSTEHPRNGKLAIVEVLDTKEDVAKYSTAISSVKCFASLKGHHLYMLFLDDYSALCGHHKDFYYKRHCATSHLMTTTSHDWYVFLDSDMEVVNPNGSFYKYINDKFDIILYDRFWNWEIMAGSFILKGNQFGRDFIKNFANFEWGHPQIANHGTDNGAIQAFVAEIVLNGREKIHDCWKIWNASIGWDDMFIHEWCVRKAMGAREEFDRVKIFRKGTAWARDGGLTGGKWSPEVDFILHGRKELNKKPWNSNMTEYWYDSRLKPLELERCRETTYDWKIRKELQINKTALYKNLKASASSVREFLKGLFGRMNKSEEIEADFVNNTEIVDHFAMFRFE